LVVAIAGVLLAIASCVFAVAYPDLAPWMRAAVPVAGLSLGIGWVYQWIQVRNGQFAKSIFAMMASACVAYSIATPVAFEVWYQKMFADVQTIAKSLENSDGQVAQYGDFMLSLLYYRRGPVDFFYHPEHIVARATCDPHDCRGVRSPLLVIVKKDKVHEITDRPGVHFRLREQYGDWCLYESTDAVLRRSPTLEELLGNQTWQDMLQDKLHAGPLTMPYGGGSLPARLQ
jgi:hypothetical protein